MFKESFRSNESNVSTSDGRNIFMTKAYKRWNLSNGNSTVANADAEREMALHPLQCSISQIKSTALEECTASFNVFH
jgi:hypothetical protein